MNTANYYQILVRKYYILVCGYVCKVLDYYEQNCYTIRIEQRRFTNMDNRTFYYARVSSKDQNLDRQLAAFKALGADERDIITRRVEKTSTEWAIKP